MSAFVNRTLRLGHGQSLTIGERGLLMGVINVTPDSFSDGGRFGSVDAAVDHARALVAAGAAILDIGAESTRPGAASVDADEEQARLLPVVAAVAQALPDAIISIDTYRADTGERAIAAGGHMLNDVWGLQKDPAMAEIAARTGAGLMIMHTNRDRDMDGDVIEDQKAFLGRSLEIAANAGVDPDAIILDPGFGFGKDTQHNVAILARFAELTGDDEFGSFCWGVGTSRKRFIGAVTGRDVDQRDVGTAATTVALRLAGAGIFRVHDVAINADALSIADAIVASGVD
ncbi:MAG: dihydropteroate synthase [Ahrensia sp.]